MIRLSQAVGALVAVAATAAIVWVSHRPLASTIGDRALVRVAFRARPERLETCVDETPEALAKVPSHMRQARLCTGTTASYRLEIRRDDVLVDTQVVHGGGVRQDRPLYVFREVTVPAGQAVIDVRFVREEASGAVVLIAPVGSAAGATGADMRQAVPPSLQFARTLSAGAGTVVLVSYDPDRRQLYLATPP